MDMRRISMRMHGRPVMERREASPRTRRRIFGVMVLVALALGGLPACARTSIENVPVAASGLPKPRLILVHDFATSATDVAFDRGLVARFRQAVSLTPEEEQRTKIEQEVARILTTHIVKELGAFKIPVQPA